MARGFDHIGRCVAGRISLRHGRLPNDFARFLVQTKQRRFFAARGADEVIAVDQGRFGISPTAGLTAKIRNQIFLPLDLTRGLVEASKIARGAKGIEPLALHRGR